MCLGCGGVGSYYSRVERNDRPCPACRGTGEVHPSPLKPIADMTPAELRAMADELERATIKRAETLLKTVSEDAVVAYLRKLGYDVIKRPAGAR